MILTWIVFKLFDNLNTLCSNMTVLTKNVHATLVDTSSDIDSAYEPLNSEPSHKVAP